MASLIFGVLGLVLRVRASVFLELGITSTPLTFIFSTNLFQYNVCAWLALVASLANITNTPRAEMDVKQVQLDAGTPAAAHMRSRCEA